jgi:hypothetical protein
MVASTALERDDGDPAVRLLWVVGEPRPALDLARVQRFAYLLALDLDGADRDGLGADLDLDIGMREEVVVPMRVGRRSALGREDHVPVVVG